MSSRLLNGLKIIEIGNGYSTAFAGMSLADYGAEITVVRTNEESSVSPHVETVLNRDKNIHPKNFSDMSSDELTTLLSSADICIESVNSEISDRISKITSSLTSLIHCKIPIAIEDEYRDWDISEETIAALTNQYEAPGGLGTPEKYYFPIVSYMSASFGINAIMMALHARLRDGQGQIVQVSQYDVGFYANMLLTISLHRAPKCWKIFKMLASPCINVWQAADNNFIYLHLGVSRHLPLFLNSLKNNGMASEADRLNAILSDHTKEDTTDFKSLKEAKTFYTAMKKLISSKPAEYWEETLGKDGICCNMSRSLNEWKETNCFKAISKSIKSENGDIIVPKPSFSINDELSDLDMDDHQIDHPYNATETTDSSAPLSGYRVIDMARIVAGPLSGKVLADAGAEVMQVWNEGAFQYWESAMYMLYTSGKKSVQIDLKTKSGKNNFDALLQDFKPHIVLHNYAPEAAKKLGLDFESIRSKCPNIVFMNITAFNARSNFSKRRGFEQTIQAISGIQDDVRGNGIPKFLPVLINDINTGLNASFAMMCALYAQKVGDHKAMNLHTSLDTPALIAQLEKVNSANDSSRAFINDREKRNRYFTAKDGMFFLSCNSSDWNQLLSESNITKDSDDNQQVEKLANYFETKSIDQIDQQFSKYNGIRIIKRRKLNKFVDEMLSRENPGAVRRYYEGIGWYTDSIIPISLSRTPLCESDAPVPLGFHTSSVLKGDYNKIPYQPKKVTKDRHNIFTKIGSVINILKQIRWILFHKKKA